jgi:hypothetical protein
MQGPVSLENVTVAAEGAFALWVRLTRNRSPAL